MTRPATTADYLATLESDRRAVVEQVRALVQRAVPEGYEEVLAFGMISWVVPLEIKPDTYNGKPLSYISLASQKNHLSLYVSVVDDGQYIVRQFCDRLGKVKCSNANVTFKRLSDLDLPVVVEMVTRARDISLAGANA